MAPVAERSPYAAMAWPASYGTLALGWALGAPGFPFGEHDLEGAAMGSVLFATRPEPTGLVMAGCCAVGVFVARAMRRPAGHRARRRVLLGDRRSGFSLVDGAAF